MEIIIEPAYSARDLAAMEQVRQAVFTHELGLSLPDLGTGDAAALHLLAREMGSGAVVAAASVIETSGDAELQQRYDLPGAPGVRVARYTQLAVLRPFRGLQLPLRLILEAQRRFVVPGHFNYTWLLFDAERAATAELCRRLAFTPSAQVYLSEYGRSRTLVRDEGAPRAWAALRQAEQFVESRQTTVAPAHPAFTRVPGRAQPAVEG